jgi:hypothetical protein
MNSNPLLCCLCQYKGTSDLDLESHIDNSHADIFCFNADEFVVDRNDSTTLQNVVVIDNDVSTLLFQDLDDSFRQDLSVDIPDESVQDDLIEKNLEKMFSEESHFKAEEKPLTHHVSKKPTKRGRKSTTTVLPKLETTSEDNNLPEQRKNKSSVSSGALIDETLMNRKRKSVSTIDSQHNGKKSKEGENPVIQASSFIQALGKFLHRSIMNAGEGEPRQWSLFFARSFAN